MKTFNLDWDSITERELETRLDFIRRYYPDFKVLYRKSGGKTGYHAKVLSPKEMTLEETFDYRRQLFDDERRIQIDMKRAVAGLSVDFLYDCYFRDGKVFEAGRWVNGI